MPAARKPPAPCALGFRVHSGWAAAVGAAMDGREPRVLLRARIELAPGSRRGPIQPYHAAEPMPLEKARAYLDEAMRESRACAGRELSRLLAEAEAAGARVAGCVVIAGSGRELPELASVLASHALIHTADGEHFREALRREAEALGLPVSRIREKELYGRASRALGMTQARLQARVAALGKALGPPWTADQKLATAAALVGSA